MMDKIKLFAMDVDGTLTDGTIYISGSGEFVKAFHVKDGYGIRAAQKAGITVAIITGRQSAIVEQRAKELDIIEIHQGVSKKDEVLCELADRLGLSREETAYIGDDDNDLSAMKVCGISFAPCDCSNQVRKQADVLLHKEGGRGAVREAIDLILAAKDEIRKSDGGK